MNISQLRAKLAEVSGARDQDDPDLHEDPEAPAVTPPPLMISEEERHHRKDRMRLLIGALAGLEYGTVGGATMGGELFGGHPGKFDKQMALRGALMGAPLGAASGVLGGALLNRIKHYTQEDRQPAPQIHLVTNPSPELVEQVSQAMKQGSAVGLTLGYFAGMMKKSYGTSGSPGSPTGSAPGQPNDPFKLPAGAALYKGKGLSGTIGARPASTANMSGPQGIAGGPTQATTSAPADTSR